MTTSDDAVVPLVLLPGMLCTQRLWEPVAALLPPGVPVVHLGLVGRSIDAMVEHVLASAPRRFDLAGLSLGGIVAMALGHAAPDRVRSLALFSTNARPPTDEQRRAWHGLRLQVEAGRFEQAAMSALLPPEQLTVGGPSPSVATDIASMVSATGASRFLDQLAAQSTRTDLRAVLPGLPHPALVVSAARDHLCSKQMHEEIAGLLRRSRFHTLRTSGHLSALEDPVAVAGLLADLTSTAPTGRDSADA